MSSSTPWRDLGDRLATRYAPSFWRLPVLTLLAVLAVFGPLYLLRGMRLVQLGVFGLVGLAGAAVAFVHPFPTLLASIFIMSCGLDVFLPGPVGLGLLSVALARVGFDALKGKSIDWGSKPFRWSLLLLLAICLTSLLVVRNLAMVMADVRNIGIGLGALIAISALADTPRRLVQVFLALALGMGVASVWPLRGVLASGGFATLPLALATRIGGLGSDPNLHAGDLNCTLPLLVAGLAHLRGWRRWTLALLIPVFIGSVILSQSRAGVALLGLTILVMAVRSGRLTRGLVIGGLVGLGVLVLALPKMYWLRFVSIGQLDGIVVDRSLLLRQHVLQNGIDIIRRHPWLGVGLGNFRTESPTYMLGGFKAHNSYLEIGGGLGVFGLLAYLVWLASGISMALRAASTWRARGQNSDALVAESIAFGLLAFCITSLTLSVEFSLVLWILLGCAIAVRRCARAAQPTPVALSLVAPQPRTRPVLPL